MAGKCGYDLRGQEMLLDALCAMGLLTKQGKAYRNTEESRSLLSKDSEQYLGYIIAHHFHILYSMGPQMCREVIRKAVGILVRGGILYIGNLARDSLIKALSRPAPCRTALQVCPRPFQTYLSSALPCPYHKPFPTPPRSHSLGYQHRFRGTPRTP
ncbi:MAG: hypothetical protein DRH15_07835 [Deltaproteobacteria bacterium]|nr:MAG: hypothetical protein DRH15_07835 [Deltaproteobacteria bacterium]